MAPGFSGWFKQPREWQPFCERRINEEKYLLKIYRHSKQNEERRKKSDNLKERKRRFSLKLLPGKFRTNKRRKNWRLKCLCLRVGAEAGRWHAAGRQWEAEVGGWEGTGEEAAGCVRACRSVRGVPLPGPVCTSCVCGSASVPVRAQQQWCLELSLLREASQLPVLMTSFPVWGCGQVGGSVGWGKRGGRGGGWNTHCGSAWKKEENMHVYSTWIISPIIICLCLMSGGRNKIFNVGQYQRVRQFRHSCLLL